MESHLSRHLLIGSLALTLLAGTASADTLREALVSTYNTNPTITAQREGLRSTDANVAIARAAGRPSLGGTVAVNRDLTQAGVFRRPGKGPFVTGGVDLSYPIFSGGSVRNSIEAAKTRVEAGRATLRAVEGDVFTEAVAAYMDVIRDRAIVELNNNQVRVLTTNLEATRDRFQIGDITRTDVAQSEARLSLGRANLATVQGRLAGSEENYRRVIGRRPDALQPPPPLPPLPTNPDQAVQIALANNPDLIAVTRQADAARLDVRTARASRLPTVSGIASGDYSKTWAAPAATFPAPRPRARPRRSASPGASRSTRAACLPRASARRRRSKARRSNSASPPSARSSPTPARRSRLHRGAECDCLEPGRGVGQRARA